jgi:CheY-like chemotaxis protein
MKALRHYTKAKQSASRSRSVECRLLAESGSPPPRWQTPGHIVYAGMRETEGRNATNSFRSSASRNLFSSLRFSATAAFIDLEITESVLMEDIAGNIEKLRAIRALGLRFEIDDFGTGHSSLAYLAKLPVDALKIDRSFIITMLQNVDTMTLVSTIISLAHALKLKVVAEGVDSEEQANMLRLLRCDEMQGYLYSRPLPAEKLIELLHTLPESPGARGQKTGGVRPATILVVDDDESMRELLRLHLTNAGYDVRLAEDAVVAGQLVLRNPPDLIIADVEMPYMDGFSSWKRSNQIRPCPRFR